MNRAVQGIIPAYAGSTPLGVAGQRDLRDHPRIRGEHGSSAYRLRLLAGSSPHTRGALLVALMERLAQGIIPAYAGSTPVYERKGSHFWDHPRIRGEHCDVHFERHLVPGSSPHTRGAPSQDPSATAPARIIPAYAGSTGWGTDHLDWRWDHPRIRGEHLIVTTFTESFVGSSPHTRGALKRHVAYIIKVGIIPAYAGSTLRRSSGQAIDRDHPRIRGEHSKL